MSSIIRSLIYVSRKIIPAWDEESVDEIVMISRPRNASLIVTGTLISAGEYFAQILEGPGAAIDELMDSIHADSRHCDITVVSDTPVTSRNFAEWSMAYSGPSPYLARNIAPLIGSARGEEEARVTRLISMMSGLAAQPQA